VGHNDALPVAEMGNLFIFHRDLRWHAACFLSEPVDSKLRRSEVLSETGRLVPGSIFSFLPADGVSRAGAVAQRVSRTLTEGLGSAVLLADFDRRAYSVWSASEAPHRLDGRTWGAFVSHVDGAEVLNAREVHARQLGPVLDYARDHYPVVCADLTAAKEQHAIEVLRNSGAIFVVANSSHSSLEGACERVSWLHQVDLGERCALLLERVPNGVSPQEAEEITGLPLCSLVESDAQIRQFATWLLASTLVETEPEKSSFALAG
jgi:Flp pilus assembly CpaE family ATPase